VPELKSLLSFAAPYRRTLTLCVALMLLESAAALAIPWLGGQLAGVLLPGSQPGSLGIGPVLLAMLCLFVLQAVLKFGNTYFLGATAEQIVSDLKVRLYNHLQALPLSFFHQRRHGDTLALLTRDVYVVSGYLSGTALSVVPLLFTVIGSLFFMFRLQPRLAALVMLAIPLFYLVLKIVGRRLRPLAARLQDEHAVAIAIAEENLGMLPAIKTFTREPEESVRFRSQIDRILNLTRRQLRIHAALDPAVQLIAAAGIVLLLWLTGAELLGGRMTPGELVSFLLYAQLLTRPVAGLADVYGQTQTARGALSRLLAALDQLPEPAADVGRRLPPVHGTIDFEDVSFSYPGRPAAIDGVSLHVEAGETVAIIGPNGAGKSTLAHLLMRLHGCSRGRILIDGIDIATVSLGSLRRQIARLARAHEFIAALPQAYDTLIGDRGVRLSGGQQQRLALARALLKNPPILILDEATAMFDPRGEAEFLDGAREALAGRTVILITHRPASLAIADRILRLDAGRILEEAGRS
jgi:ATP-binding cassette subfamily B protein